MADDGGRGSTKDTKTAGQGPPRRPGRFLLRIRKETGSAPVKSVKGPVITIGRSRTADLSIDDASISALHAEIRVGSRFIELVDLGSHNGTYLNGRAVWRVALQPGDEIRLGSCVLELVGIEESDDALYPKDHFGDVLGHSRVMRELFGRLAELAPTPLTVLINGETGTGKEEIARSMHAASPRSDGPFVVLDCGCLPPTLVESALFGHVRGAFTGAVVDQAGAFEQANGGTIFIDEVGELPMEQQVKLLRVLDRREYKRVGDNRTRTADARVIAATHRDLRKRVEAGTFREDLYYRLARATVVVPPLRSRDEDIEVLARAFLDRHDKRLTLEDSARAALREHDWPGNVRELQSVIEQAAFTVKGSTISRAQLLLQERRDRATKLEEALRLKREYADVHRAVDQWLLPMVIEECKGIIVHAAKVLGMSPNGLRNRMKKLKLFELEDEEE